MCVCQVRKGDYDKNLIVIAHIYLTEVWMVRVKRGCEGDQQGFPEVRELLFSLGTNMTTCIIISSSLYGGTTPTQPEVLQNVATHITQLVSVFKPHKHSTYTENIAYVDVFSAYTPEIHPPHHYIPM